MWRDRQDEDGIETVRQEEEITYVKEKLNLNGECSLRQS